MSVTQKKVVFFTADTLPTSAELLEIARLDDLAASPYKIQVRNGGGTEKMESIETCDYVAGTVPTAYAAKTLFGTDGKIHADRPLDFKALPLTASIANSATFQLYPVKVAGSNAEDAAISVVASGVVWSVVSGTSATINSSSGLVTAHASTDGNTVVRATYTYASGKTFTADVTITVA